MEVIILDGAEDVAAEGADRICELLSRKPYATLGLATGRTPIAMYGQLIERHASGKVSFRETTTFNLDEYIGIGSDSPQSYRSFMNEVLFESVDIELAHTHFPYCGQDDNPRKVGKRYESLIAVAGGIDLQILGIGSNGHIGFNEPTSSLASRTRVKTLTESTVRDNSRLFMPGEFQPRLAMTMGIATILDSKQLLLLATGENKAAAVRAAVEGPVASVCPASALQHHEHATILLDEAAASELQYQEYYKWARAENAQLVEKFGNYYPLALDTEPN